MDGTEVLDKLVSDGVDAAVVMISGHGDIDTAVECIKKGAFDFIQKPLDLNRILITIKNATEKATIIGEQESQEKGLRPADDRRVGAHGTHPGNHRQSRSHRCSRPD